MNGYDSYLQSLLDLKEQEIRMYKEFIEGRLGCKIQETIRNNVTYEETGDRMAQYKVITIPQSQFMIRLN